MVNCHVPVIIVTESILNPKAKLKGKHAVTENIRVARLYVIIISATNK